MVLHGYIGFYNGKRHETHAEDLLEAKTKVITHFKVPRSKRPLVSVVLAEVDGKPVTHVATE
jgi:hypothetical protein